MDGNLQEVLNFETSMPSLPSAKPSATPVALSDGSLSLSTSLPRKSDTNMSFRLKMSTAELNRVMDRITQFRRDVEAALLEIEQLFPFHCQLADDVCPMLKVPREIRDHIYKLLIEEVSSSAESPIGIFSEPYALPHVCKLFQKEVDLTPVYDGQYYLFAIPFLNFAQLEQWMDLVGSVNVNSLAEINISFAGTYQLETRQQVAAAFLPIARMVINHWIRPDLLRVQDLPDFVEQAVTEDRFAISRRITHIEPGYLSTDHYRLLVKAAEEYARMIFDQAHEFTPNDPEWYIRNCAKPYLEAGFYTFLYSKGLKNATKSFDH